MEEKTHLIYKPSQKPTFWNKDRFIGAAVGSMIFGPLTAFIGYIVGGKQGKLRQQNEQIYGKAVSPKSSFFNVDAFLGTAIGAGIGAIAAFTIIAASASFPPLGLIALAVAPAMIGFTAGGFHGEKRQKAEYEHAKEWVKQNGGRNFSPSQEPVKAQNLDAPAVSQTVEHESALEKEPQYEYSNSVPSDKWEKLKAKIDGKDSSITKSEQYLEQKEVSSAKETAVA